MPVLTYSIIYSIIYASYVLTSTALTIACEVVKMICATLAITMLAIILSFKGYFYTERIFTFCSLTFLIPNIVIYAIFKFATL